MTNQTGSIEPTVGRVMFFMDHLGEGIYDSPKAAIVAAVLGSNRVNLMVVGTDGQSYSSQAVPIVQADDPIPHKQSYACWMPYQVGQAKQSQDLVGKLQDDLIGLSTQVTGHFTQFANFRDAVAEQRKSDRCELNESLQAFGQNDRNLESRVIQLEKNLACQGEVIAQVDARVTEWIQNQVEYATSSNRAIKSVEEWLRKISEQVIKDINEADLPTTSPPVPESGPGAG